MTSPEELATIVVLQNSIKNDEEPPEHLSGPLKALWHVGKGNFEHAAKILESDASKEAAWVRAHLHRRRDEDEEAAAWYEKADRIAPTDPVDREWTQIAAGLLLNP